jgi:Na+-transporting NADH:ubiquinone oxidoreductase subunit C
VERSVSYTLRFAAIVAAVASFVVATVAVSLEARQEANRVLDRRRHVLEVVGLSQPGETLSRAEVARRFEENIRPLVVELRTGEVAEELEAEALDQRRASRDPEQSRPAPPNAAGISRLPRHVIVHQLVRDGTVEALVLPFEGLGLWSTMYGYLALSGDLATVRGITFYEHAETAGLGALVSDPDWRALWEGKRVFDEEGRPRIRVIKGRVGTSTGAAYEVDGLSGATLTGNGVTAALHFWLGEDILGPYLARYRAERGIP